MDHNVAMTLALPSRPEATVRTRVLLRYVAVVAAAVLCANLHVRRPPTLCLMRALTGVPCPFCGGTTSTVALAHGHLSSAFAASPIAPLMLVAAPWLGQLRMPALLRRRVIRWSVVAAALVIAEVWQLARFGLLHG